VRRAAGLYRLHLAIAFGGGLGLVLGSLVAWDAARTHQQSPRMLVAAVMFSQPSIAGGDAALLLMLGALVTSSLAFGVRAAVIEWRGQQRLGQILRRSARIEVGAHAVGVFREDRPRAFCHGLMRPRIYVSSGALAALGPAELAALLAHERHHARRRDPLRRAVARMLGGALFFLPVLPRLLERYRDEAELAADEAALRDGHAAALAAALLAFDDSGAGVHPDRVDRLLGEQVEARMPIASILVAAAAIVGLVVAGLAGATRNGHDYPLLVLPALLVGSALAAVALVAPTGLLGGVVRWRRGRRRR
jgi:Zn-dependent protease with chaperone function